MRAQWSRARRVLHGAMALALAGCAAGAPAERAGPWDLRGCWIERRGDTTVTQRWFPQRDLSPAQMTRRSAWRGDQLTYVTAGAPDAVRWRLRPERGGDGWRLCLEEPSKASAPACWRAFFGPGAAEGEDTRWVELRTGPDLLRIVFVTDGERALTYDGRRDGCD